MKVDAAGFWAERTGRERLLLTVAFGLGAVWFAFIMILQPMQEKRGQMEQRITRYESAIAWLSQPEGAAPIPLSADTRPVPQIVTALAEAQGLTIRRLEPEGDMVRVTLDDARFEAVVLWLEKLETDSALRIMALALSRRPTPGLVSTTVSVQR